MAQGDLVIFEEFAINVGSAEYNLTSDTLSAIMITTLPAPGQASPDRSDFTEVTAGGGYTTGGIALTTTYTEAGGIATLDSSTNPSWTKAAGSPTNCMSILIVNDTHAGGVDAIGYVDLSTDGGTTPASLVDDNITCTWDASGIFRLTVS